MPCSMQLRLQCSQSVLLSASAVAVATPIVSVAESRAIAHPADFLLSGRKREEDMKKEGGEKRE